MDEENRRRSQLGLAMLGLPLVVAVLLSAWSAATGGIRRAAPADPGGTGAAPVGLLCTGKACQICEQNGGT